MITISHIDAPVDIFQTLLELLSGFRENGRTLSHAFATLQALQAYKKKQRIFRVTGAVRSETSSLQNSRRPK